MRAPAFAAFCLTLVWAESACAQFQATAIHRPEPASAALQASTSRSTTGLPRERVSRAATPSETPAHSGNPAEEALPLPLSIAPSPQEETQALGNTSATSLRDSQPAQRQVLWSPFPLAVTAISSAALAAALAALILALQTTGWRGKMNRLAQQLQPPDYELSSRDILEWLHRSATQQNQQKKAFELLQKEVSELRLKLDQIIEQLDNASKSNSPSRYPTIRIDRDGDRNAALELEARAPAPRLAQPPPTEGQALGAEPAWLTQLLGRYREAANEPTDAAFQLRDLGLQGVQRSGDQYVLTALTRQVRLWAVPAPERPGLYALLPGSDALINWLHLSPNRGVSAQEYFGPAWELEASDHRGPTVQAIPLLQELAGSLAVRQRGRLAGFSS